MNILHFPRAWLRRLSFPLLVYVIALVVRLVPVIMAADLQIGLDDMFQYDMLARSIASGNGYRWYQPDDLDLIVRQLRGYIDFDQSALPTDPRGILTSFRPPLYPAFLAGVYLLSGLEHRFLAARVAQAFILASLAPLTYYLAQHLDVKCSRARWAAVVPALWPMLVVYPLGLVTENLFIPLLTAGLLVLFIATEHGRMRSFVLAGGLLGLATLARSVIVGFPLLAAGWLWWRGLRRQAIALTVASLAVTMPWAVRNSLLHGHPTFVETSLGYNLYMGYHPEGDGSFQFGISLDLVPILDDAERDELGRQMALGFVRDDPLRAAWLVLRKLGHLWGLEDRAFVYFYSNGLLGEWPPWAVMAALGVLMLPLVLLLPLSTLGLASGPRSSAWWLSVILLLYYTGVHVLVMADERYHLALVPVLAALGARGLGRLPEMRESQYAIHTRSWQLVRAALVALVILLAVFNWSYELAVDADRLTQLVRVGGSTTHFNY